MYVPTQRNQSLIILCSEQLVGKVYGKTKIYYVNQMGIQLPSEEQRRETEDDIKKIEGDCAAMEKKSRDAEALLASIHSEISDENLNVKIESLEKEIETIQQVVDQFDGKERAIIPPEQKQRLKQNFTKFRVLSMHCESMYRNSFVRRRGSLANVWRWMR